MVIISYISYMLLIVFIVLIIDITIYITLEKRKKLINSMLEIR